MSQKCVCPNCGIIKDDDMYDDFCGICNQDNLKIEEYDAKNKTQKEMIKKIERRKNFDISKVINDLIESPSDDIDIWKKGKKDDNEIYCDILNYCKFPLNKDILFIPIKNRLIEEVFYSSKYKVIFTFYNYSNVNAKTHNYVRIRPITPTNLLKDELTEIATLNMAIRDHLNTIDKLTDVINEEK